MRVFALILSTDYLSTLLNVRIVDSFLFNKLTAWLYITSDWWPMKENQWRRKRRLHSVSGEERSVCVRSVSDIYTCQLMRMDGIKSDSSKSSNWGLFLPHPMKLWMDEWVSSWGGKRLYFHLWPPKQTDSIKKMNRRNIIKGWIN